MHIKNYLLLSCLCLVLAVGSIATAQSPQIAYFKFDEGAGAIALSEGLAQFQNGSLDGTSRGVLLALVAQACALARQAGTTSAQVSRCQVQVIGPSKAGHVLAQRPTRLVISSLQGVFAVSEVA